MMRTALLGTLVIISGANASSGAPAKCYDWMIQERIRGGYMASNDPLSGVAQMKAAGMNTLMPKFGGLQASPTPDNIALLRAWGEASAKAGMHLLPVFNFRGGETEKLLSERREVTVTGQRLAATPCPLDEAFWEKYILGRFAWLAEHAQELHLDGAILDPEMYGSDHTVFMAPCYCDDCLREFLKDAGQALPEPLPAPDRRAEWVKAQGLSERFEQRFVTRVEGFSRRIEQEAHAKNTDFAIGVLLLDYDTPFMRGMAQGFGTEMHPVLGFSETTYSPGYSGYVKKQQAAFGAYPAQVLFVPGIWQQQFPADNLAEQYYWCAADSAGYWIYTFESLLEDCSKLPGYALREPNERYWAAMKLANAELDKLAASGGKYVSGLKVREFDPPLPVLSTGDLKPETLVASPDDRPLSLGPVTVPRLRYRNPLYILARAGEPVEARVTNVQLASYRPGTQWVVVDPEGKRVVEGHMKVGESATVRFTPERDGVYMMVASSDNNSHSVVLQSAQRCAFKAVKGQPLTVNGQFGRMYFHVLEGIARFSIFAKAEGQAAGRGGQLAVYAPDGVERAHIGGDLGSWTEMVVDVPAGMGGRVWGLSAEGLTNDLSVYFTAGTSPFMSPDPARVLVGK